MVAVTITSLSASDTSSSHCVKGVQIRSFSSPYFPAFGLNTERYGISLRIQSKCGKKGTRKNSVFGHFSRSVNKSFAMFNLQTIRYNDWSCTTYWYKIHCYEKQPLSKISKKKFELCKCLPFIIKLITRFIVINIATSTSCNCPLLKDISVCCLVWLTSNYIFGSDNFWDKPPFWFLKVLKLPLFYSGNLKIFKNALGQFIPIALPNIGLLVLTELFFKRIFVFPKKRIIKIIIFLFTLPVWEIGNTW